MIQDQFKSPEKDRLTLRNPLGIGILAGLVAVSGGLLLAFGGPLAGVAFIVAVSAAFLIFRDIEYGFWGVVAVICLIPFATIPIDIGLTPTLLDIILGVTVGIWLLQLATGRRRTITTSLITIPIVIFLIVAVFSFVFGLGNGPLTPSLLRHFAELLLSIGFALVVVDYFGGSDGQHDANRLNRMISIILIFGVVAAVVGIFLWLLPDFTANDLLNLLQRVGYPGGFVIRYIEDNSELSERAIGTAVDPNALGGLLVMIGALAAPQLVAQKPLLSRRLILVMTGLIFLCLVLTFSRGAMLGLVAALAFLALIRYRRLIPLIFIAGVIFLILPITQVYLLRFAEGFLGQDLATQMRFGEYRDAATLISRYPLFGVGFSGSPDLDLYLGVASVYLTIAQQMGFLGLAAFLTIISAVFGYAYFNRTAFNEDAPLDAIWLGLHAAIVGSLVVGIFDHYIFNIDFHHAVTIFWLFLGLAVAATRLGTLTEPSQ